MSVQAKTMHYGGHLKSNGKLSSLPAAGQSFSKVKRLEMIVRMENAGIPERALASMLMISVPRLRYIKKSADYLSTRLRITHGLVLDADATLGQIKEQRREYLKQFLPPAMQIIANVLQTAPSGLAEKKLQVAVAQDIMDREGSFAKITRTEVKPVDAFDFERHDPETQAIIDAVHALGAGAPQESQLDQIKATVLANDQFAKSATISAVDQQEALDELEAAATTALLEAESETNKIQ